MKIEKLESYLGKKVRVKLSDRELIGVLARTRTDAVKHNINLYLYKPNFYVVLFSNGDNSLLFRGSYVRSVKEVV